MPRPCQGRATGVPDLSACSGGTTSGEPMRLAIFLQREIARLHQYDQHQSNRQIAGAIGVAANTVRAVRERLRACTVPWEQLSQLGDDDWISTLGTHDNSIARRKEAPDWIWVHQEMERPDATLEQLWREWRETCPDGIGYTQFTSGYREYCDSRHIVMRRVHVPGEKLFVDYAGRTIEIRDTNGGPSVFAQIFIAVLGHSNFTFAHATATQTTEDWISSHVRCFETIGGAPKWVVSDNLKAAVWRREKDRVIINPAYRECLKHYDTAALPTGVRKPKHKAKAEVGVQIVQRLLFRFRDRVFFSLDELNAELRTICDKLNDHPFKAMPGCRLERFEAAEKAKLKPLPDRPYELSDWRYGVRVGDDYHVPHDGCYYSVACSLIGEKVDLRFTGTVVEAFHRGRRVALHSLLKTVGEVSTLPDHRPVAHQRVLDGEPKALMAWAESVGPNAAAMIRFHLLERSDATNGVAAARRMRDLARLHGDPRFEEVCAYALPLNITALRSVASVLKSGADKRSSTTKPVSVRPSHANVRGAEYFGDPT